MLCSGMAIYGEIWSGEAVKLGSGWAALVQAGRVTFRYGGLRQGGQDEASLVDSR